ncbi:O-acetyl-ADP-ribose deacetylase [Pontibacillus salicampi]|uniref:O-acetyl-ADP-ribose deacetylase n=1 Tax=Pontibacillus salicampi TaxID=1449801 RepID=A0ABV6LME3_9BACI
MNIEVVKGDITAIEVDAIVNAANRQLAGGGGVDGAIHRAGGPEIMAACREIGECPTGEAVITTGGKLPSPYVIHTVGPVWKDGSQREDELLASCYRQALSIAEKNYCKKVAFPNISTGVYGFPKQRAAQIALDTVRNQSGYVSEVEEVIFVCFDQENKEIYDSLL